MAATRTKIAAQDACLKAIAVAASAHPSKDIATEMHALARAIGKRWGVVADAPASTQPTAGA